MKFPNFFNQNLLLFLNHLHDSLHRRFHLVSHVLNQLIGFIHNAIKHTLWFIIFIKGLTMGIH